MSGSPDTDQLVLAHYARANALFDSGRLDEAVGGYRAALELDPRHRPSLNNLALALNQCQDFCESETMSRRSLAIDPDDAEAHAYLGQSLHGLGRLQEALRCADAALSRRPDFAQAHNARGSYLAELQDPDAALAAFDEALRLAPGFVAAWFNRAAVLEKLGRGQEARSSYQRVLELTSLAPQSAPVLTDRGNALLQLDRWEEALESYERAIRLDPRYAPIYANRGTVLRYLGRLEEAADSYGRAIELNFDVPLARMGRAHTRLLAGRLEEAWSDFESRWQAFGLRSGLPPELEAIPLWLGAEPLAGRTILLYGEQGLGDMIQFCRYARLVSERGARVLLQVPASLSELFGSLAGVDAVVPAGKVGEPIDLRCPLMSLALAFGTTLATIPSPGRYLHSEPDARARWRRRIGAGARPRVGLAWSGRAAHKLDRHRSIALELLAQCLPAGPRYYVLQNDIRAQDRAALVRWPAVSDLSREVSGFKETAAAIEQLDLVVSVDTSIAHLSGALGKPTWLLLPFAPDSRWLLGRTDSPWYASMTLFRQRTPGDWRGVLDQVAAQLRTWQSPGAAP